MRDRIEREAACLPGMEPMTEYATWQKLFHWVVWIAANCFYRFRVWDRHHLPRTGGALLVCNHVSWLDGFLVLLLVPRPIHIIAWSGNFQARWLQAMARRWGVIFIRPERRKDMLKALGTARDALRRGELVCIFPEGGITRTGQLQAFKPGAMWLLKDNDVPVIPVYFDELWGSIFSYSEGRFFWKWPKKWRYPISMHFGPPLTRPRHLHQIRNAVQELGAIAVMRRADRFRPVAWSFLQSCKRRLFGSKIADTLGADLSGGMILMRTLILRRILRRGVFRDDERHVGVLLPPGAAGAIVNAAIAVDRRVPINLNYTVTSDIMNACIKQADIRTVLTSRRFMEKMKFDIDANIVYLEDFKDRAKLSDKIVAAFQTYVVPSALLVRLFGLRQIQPDDLQTIIFTSGSTGVPKGVMLSQLNVASNVESIDQVVHLRRDDVMLGILPFFHSFGYTVTLWGTLALDIKGVYHFTPLDARQIGQLSRKHGVSVILSTPTFLRGFLRRCEPEDFHRVDVVITGAEKLPRSLADAFEERFGVRPLEGYGTTELSPVVSVNVPPSRTWGDQQSAAKEGSVGRPFPGVAAKTVHLDTGEELGPDEPGMLLIKGPNVMLGYYQRPDLTKEVLHDGWYTTGDIAVIDRDGFIHITGRQSRFSKIGGEMVPHIEIEEKLAALVSDDDDTLHVAVTAVPDPRKGERLVVLHTAIDKSPEELRRGLTEMGLPNLYIPSLDSFLQVDEIPVLGSGKLDLKRVQQVARERLGCDAAN